MQKIETSNSLFQKDSDNIVWLSYPDKTCHSLETMNEYLMTVSDLGQNHTGVLLLVNMTNLIGVSNNGK